MDPNDALAALRAPNAQSLSIISLTASKSSPSTLPPAALAADLTHYRDLFSKLRFSYLEQVTKERFLRTLTADPPEFADAQENAELEERLVGLKARLKEKKGEVRDMIGELEEQGRVLAGRYEQLQLQTAQLETLPATIAGLQDTISRLEASAEPRSANPEQNLSLPETNALVQQREQELTSLDVEIERLQAALPAKKVEVQRLRDELAPVQLRKIKAVEEAEEAKRRRADGGRADELEDQGRWLRGVEGALKGMLEV
ncbi:hypothetical protein TI39_contig4290g00001 [Zymoseptoria brevis]|uniref:Kinetochore protein Sos7 coiled-coil domain-containing protein n=1 Tax=Zymoseptoria brevis TaxID=1047168 RepID=A0A0F4G893_9PEZI|nr:hypothetical protein TI39_contig4290g00001 [Zymoseptoria brevis]